MLKLSSTSEYAPDRLTCCLFAAPAATASCGVVGVDGTICTIASLEDVDEFCLAQHLVEFQSERFGVAAARRIFAAQECRLLDILKDELPRLPRCTIVTLAVVPASDNHFAARRRDRVDVRYARVPLNQRMPCMFDQLHQHIFIGTLWNDSWQTATEQIIFTLGGALN